MEKNDVFRFKFLSLKQNINKLNLSIYSKLKHFLLVQAAAVGLKRTRRKIEIGAILAHDWLPAVFPGWLFNGRKLGGNLFIWPLQGGVLFGSPSQRE